MSPSVIKFKQCTQCAIEYVADNMRTADVVEITAASGTPPLLTLNNGVDASMLSAVAYANDEPIAVLGLVSRGLLSDTGVPWLLGTHSAMKHKRAFLQESPPVIAEMLRHTSKLENWVHAKNKTSIRWLKWLGFTIDEPVPFGVSGELFHRFHMGY